jgi:hypothetical protein
MILMQQARLRLGCRVMALLRLITAAGTRLSGASMHTLRNFKSFAAARIDLCVPVTVLIGRTATGTTNVIEAVELLAHLAHGRSLHEVTGPGRGGPLEIRGGTAAYVRAGTAGFELGFSGECAGETLTYAVRPRPDPRRGPRQAL